MERTGGSFHDYHQMNNNPTINLNMNNNKYKAAETTRNNINGYGEEEECRVREQDRFMPIANVIRIMRKMVPPHAKISDDAKETVQECVSEFIGFVTGEANERCQREQRKTITAEDILYAMSKLGFDSYVDTISLFLHRYRQLESGSVPANRSAAYSAQPHVTVTVGQGCYGQFPPPPPPPATGF